MVALKLWLAFILTDNFVGMCQDLKPYMNSQREFRKECRIDQLIESTVPHSLNADIKYRSQQIKITSCPSFLKK